MAKPLVLIDVDWTLLNDLFHFEPNGLAEKIKVMTAAGWEIGLMSDRPQNELMEFSDELGMNGPLLAELGNVLIYPRLDICKCWRTYDERSKMSMFTKRAIITLMEKFPNLPILLSSNVRQFREFQNLNWPREKVIAAVHTQRRTSFLVNVHRYGPDGLMEAGAERSSSMTFSPNRFFLSVKKGKVAPCFTSPMRAKRALPSICSTKSWPTPSP